MRHLRLIQSSAALLLALLLILAGGSSARAAGQPLAAHQSAKTTSVNAHVYLTQQLLQPLFQSSIDQAMPQMFSAALSDMLGQVSEQDRGWVREMADALLQPSATLVSLSPQKDGLMATLKIQLYSGDPKATSSSVLVGFKVLNPTTIQVSALPLPDGGQSLVSGPISTFTLSIGSLTGVSATPNCGDSDLNLGIKFPVDLTPTAPAATPTSSGLSARQSSGTEPLSAYQSTPTPGANGGAGTQHPTDSYIELPASSLTQLGSGFGTIQVSGSLSAENVQISVQGANLMLSSKILWYGLPIGTAVSTMQPGASNGNLVVHVSKTVLKMGFISFPLNSYNQKIEQILNSQLNGALTGTFYVNQATLGHLPHLTCSASDSLLMAGQLQAA